MSVLDTLAKAYQDNDDPYDPVGRITSLCAIIDVNRLLNAGSLGGLIKNDFGAVAVATVFSLLLKTLDELVVSESFNQGSKGQLTALATQLMRTITADSQYNFLYNFRLYPYQEDVVRKKLNTITDQGWGRFDVQHFGEALIPIELQLSTGTMKPPNELWERGIYDPRISLAYLKFVEFERYVEACSPKMLFFIYGNAYFGVINGIKYTKEFERQPREIKFNLSLTVLPYLSFSLGNITTVIDFFKNKDLLWEEFIYNKDLLTNASEQKFDSSLINIQNDSQTPPTDIVSDFTNVG